MKKDIYEHLADIYLDASFKKRRKAKKYPQIFRNLFFASTAIILFLLAFLFVAIKAKNAFIRQEVALVLSEGAVKINFHFDPAKKETYSLDLNKLNLKKFKALGFSAKKVNYKDNIALRVEFTNVFKEKSEVYVKGIADKWENYKINFSEFKGMGDWSEMSNLSFVIEEWNVKEKRGIVYLDNVRFLR